MNRAHSIVNAAGRDLLYVLGVLAASIVEFVVWVTGVSMTASLLVLVIGVAAWLATVVVFRFAARRVGIGAAGSVATTAHPMTARSSPARAP